MLRFGVTVRRSRCTQQLESAEEQDAYHGYGAPLDSNANDDKLQGPRKTCVMEDRAGSRTASDQPES